MHHKLIGSKWLNRGVQSIEHRFATAQRNLLFENYVNESREAGCSSPEWRRAVFCEDISERLIACGEFARSSREGLSG